MNFSEKSSALFMAAQKKFCAEIEAVDGSAQFLAEQWEREDEGSALGGGGGLTCILRKGRVFEQAGVNFSKVSGTLSVEMCQRLGVPSTTPQPFFATGISVVIHPYSPMIPTTHANFRFLQVAEKSWFGGGADLTPYYLYDEDARHFHQRLKTGCDRYDPEAYQKYKQWCDEYFYLPHRQETRGVGGIFFDYIGREDQSQLDKTFSFVEELALALGEVYLPIVERRKGEVFTQAQKDFQLLRRGRYVEFNLLYDRGTLFGLKTNGRTESILMSLPPEVRWEYNFQPQAGTREAELLAVVKTPRAWL